LAILVVGRLKAENQQKGEQKGVGKAHTDNPSCMRKASRMPYRKLIKQAEDTLSPDNEAAKMATRSELKEIQSPHVDKLDAGQVAESLDNAVILVVDYKRTAATRQC
jgi:hypothetical protein